MYPFVHLRVQSDYSVSRGASKVKDLVKTARAHGQPALALADEEALHGAMELTKYCEAEGVQPVLGAKVYVPLAKKGTGRGSMILLAMSDVGYANVCRLLNMDLTPGRPRTGVIDADMFRMLSADRSLVKDVICLAGSGADSCLGQMLPVVGADSARGMAHYLKGLFEGCFYVEVCRNGHPDAAAVGIERQVLEIALDLDLPIVGTTDACYASPDRHDSYAIIRAVAEGRKASVAAAKEGLIHASPVRHHLRDSDEMWDLFHDLPEAFVQPSQIALRCRAKASKRKPILPSFAGEGTSESDELRRQSVEGLEARLAAIPDADPAPYRDRLDYELGVIEGMGFPGYFLIVSDFIKYAKSRDIPVGPGRGSGAGSVVAWALTITDLDPLRFGLLFERFLNPERVSMPDFDIDFCESGRSEVIQYVERRYGRDRVAGIATFSEIKSKTALRDVARVVFDPDNGALGQMEINGLCQLVPPPKNGKELKLGELYDEVPEFADRVDANVRARLVYDNTLKVEGLFRQTGAHAAGIVIAGDTLTNLVPVGYDPKTGFPVVQLNMKDSEAAGLVKFDFLGLTTLSVIKEALAHVKDTTGVDLDMAALPFDDATTLRMFGEGRTTGIFQFESDGMKRALRDVRADRIEDLIAVNALFRPGPMQFIEGYAACKNGRQAPRYPEPVERTKPFLEETHGYMVYQEQVMQVAQVVAGYSLGGADLLRRAMGKKIKAEMDAQRVTFVDGAVATSGLSKKVAESLFDDIAKFADYGFNKSHAAAYSVVAYHTGYLKAHHPIAFLSALLSYETDDKDKMKLIKQDMDAMGIEFLLPDINESVARFVPQPGPDKKMRIRFGLMAVKNVSSDVVDQIVAERVANGRFRDLRDFHARAGHLLNSGQVQKLAEAGAFDCLDANRRRSFETLQWLARHNRKDDTTIDLFGGASEVVVKAEILDMEEWKDPEDKEHEAIGFSLRKNPLDVYGNAMQARGAKRRKSIIEWMVDNRKAELNKRKLFGLVDSVEFKHGSRGPFVGLRLAEKEDSYWVNVFPENAEVEVLFRMLKFAKETRCPVVVIANFSPGSKGPGDMWVTGTDAYRVEDYMAEHWRSTTYEIKFDPRQQGACSPGVAAAIAEAQARVDVAPPSEVDDVIAAQSLVVKEAIAPEFKAFMQILKDRVGKDDPEPADGERADALQCSCVVPIRDPRDATCGTLIFTSRIRPLGDKGRAFLDSVPFMHLGVASVFENVATA